MNNVNYARQLDHLLEQPETKGKHLFLHSCCAPCSSYVLAYLNKYFNILKNYDKIKLSEENKKWNH